MFIYVLQLESSVVPVTRQSSQGLLVGCNILLSILTLLALERTELFSVPRDSGMVYTGIELGGAISFPSQM